MKTHLIFIFVCMILQSCSAPKCTNKANIEISELIYIHAKDHSIPYCKLLQNAATKDTSALISFLNLQIMDGAGYDHGDIILSLFEYLGEDFVQSATKNFSEKEIINVKNYINVGMEYSIEYENQEFSDLFPKLYQSWY